MEHFIDLNDLDLSTIEKLLDFADNADHVRPNKEKLRFAANLFFEPSTRTRFSFEVAEKKTGFDILNFDQEVSSTQKGESVIDTIKTLEAIGADTCIIRTSETGLLKKIKDDVSIPLVNAGDGTGHHPTQALLDLLTISQEFTVLQGLKVAIIGDLRHSRVARSNIEMLTRLGAEVRQAGPPEWLNPDLQAKRVCMEEAVEDSDVVYLLRIQHERHAEAGGLSREAYHQAYGLTEERERRMKKNSIIMHPAPFNRDVEIASPLVECGRSRIFKQMANGVKVRMAVLDWVYESKEENRHAAFN